MIKPLSALLALALAPLALPAPVDPQALAVVRALRDQDAAVAATGYRLATANDDLCIEHMIESGILIETLGQYGADYRPAAAQLLGLTDAPTVALVVPGSPADRAGIAPGDVLVEADGKAFAASPPETNDAKFAPVDVAMTTLDAALADGRASLTIRRGGRDLTIAFAGVKACRGRFQVIPGNDADAVANGTWVQISTRMMQFATNPDELAAILGHELAHNALGHRKAPASVQRVHELQADRLMPYLMQRAGYDTRGAVTLYQRFKSKRLGGLFPSATHPGWSDRLKAVEAERARIAAIMSAGDTIVPPNDLIAR